MDVTTFRELLTWLATPAGLAAVGGALAMWLRDNEWFESLPGKKKSTLMFLMTVIVLPLSLVYLPKYLTQQTIDVVSPIFDVIMLGAVAYFGSQLVHEYWNKPVIERRNASKEVDIESIFED
ncbi:MAG: hypothetical protein ACXABY_11645 [Candidatus Thorarchaeota archaeon]|jgi:magnesium-transporting ATPase (P-type)